MDFDEQPMSRKIIENGHEVSPGCTDKAIKKIQFKVSRVYFYIYAFI